MQIDYKDLPIVNKLDSDYEKYLNSESGFVVLIDKSPDWTSFDVVNKLKRNFGIKKIGHAGTLDPFATGLLVICVRRNATRQISLFQNYRKIYRAHVKLGEITDSYDRTGNLLQVSDNLPDMIRIKEVLSRYIGKIKQIPPVFSALKYKGKRMYEYARAGLKDQVVIKSRDIEIFGIEDVTYNAPILKFTVEVSKGTYIRSLAYDIGQDLGCGAHLSKLRRLSIGDFSVSESLRIKELFN